MTERKTETIVRDALRKLEYYDDDAIIIEEQKSDNPRINKLLKNASKAGKGPGYPEFIIRSIHHSDFLIIIECKADIKKHESKECDKFADYAVDGALLYASYLSTQYDVIAIGVSGQKEKAIKVSHFLFLRKDKAYFAILGDNFLTFDNYYESYIHHPKKFNQDYQSLLNYSSELNEILHDKKVVESQRSLLISGILIALQNKAFKQGYKGHNTAQQLTDHLVNTIVNELRDANLPERRIINLKQAFSFITTHPTLSTEKQFTENLIIDIGQRIDSFLKTYKYIDTIGHFYIEFLRYANNDKSLGIVLTPLHITELFTELANVNKDSVVLDNCCGTGGFIISAMKKMILGAKGNQCKVKRIQDNQFIGIEFQNNIYALAISNMILHGDGKTNVYQGNCFKLVDKIKGLYKPSVGFLNPPYKVKKEGIEELEFVLNNLEMLEPHGKCIAIVPMNCAVSCVGNIFELKNSLLKKHTLEAVMSMPDELFHNSDIAVITCVMIFTAHIPHPQNKKTWFGYWKDDGLIKVRKKGRIDKLSKWQNIMKEWVNSFSNREIQSGHSVMQRVSAKDEWCAEAYMETEYETLTVNAFIKSVKEYVVYKFLNRDLSDISSPSMLPSSYKIDTHKWKYFKYNDVFAKIQIAKSIDLNKLAIVKDGINYAGRTRENNGITARVLLHDDESINEGNCITIPMVGASTCYSFYQESSFFASQNILILRLPKLNIFNALFINNVIELERFRFSYGRTLTKSFFPQHLIKLPSTRQDKVDWSFMERYIKSLPYSGNL